MALVAQMERELVERRQWFTLDEFRDGVAVAQLAPGPLAAQIAMYLGWLRGGVLGSAVSGIAFVLPSFLMVAAIAAFYVAAGGAPWLRALFFGVGAAVVAVLARSATRLLRRTTAGDRRLVAVAIVNALLVVFTRREIVSLLLLSGAAPFLWSQLRARRLAPAALVTTADPSQLLEIFVFFSKAALVVFGSGLAIIPFLQAEVVTERGWLTEPQFLDAIAVAMLTPGPVVITVAFIGWLVAGPLGGLAAALGVFAPTWLVTVVGAPLYDRVRGSAAVREVVAGITAAATGALAGAVIIVAVGAITTWQAAILALLALIVLRRRPTVPEPLVILAAALAGLALSP